jgi:hypothetical protein
MGCVVVLCLLPLMLWLWVLWVLREPLPPCARPHPPQPLAGRGDTPGGACWARGGRRGGGEGQQQGACEHIVCDGTVCQGAPSSLPR